MLYYTESQDIREGQKQHPIETKELMKIRAAYGLTKSETIHCMKYYILCLRKGWNLEEAAKRINITRGDCLNLWDCKIPFTDKHQEELYKTSEIKISTIRINEEAHALYESRLIRFQEIYREYSYAKPAIKMTRSLLGKVKPVFSRQFFANYGLAFKCWRAAFHETQYSVADKIFLHYGKRKDLPFTKRDSWHVFETSNVLTKTANIAFYNTFGETVEQVTAPFREYFRINGQQAQEQIQEMIKEMETLQKIEAFTN